MNSATGLVAQQQTLIRQERGRLLGVWAHANHAFKLDARLIG